MNLNEVAVTLADARRNNSLVNPDLLNGINNTTDAYAVQEKAIAAFLSTQIGYKVAATNAETQKKFDCNEPFYGPLFENECYQSSTTISIPPGMLGGEAEFAFQIAKDLPTDTSLTIDDLPEFIASANVSVELIGRRTSGAGLPSLFAAIADFGGNSGFVKGRAIEGWQTKDLSAVAVVAKTNGKETNAGNGAAVMGHPLNSLLWLHNRLIDQGKIIQDKIANRKGLCAGDWISTGTCLGVIAVVPDSTVEIDFAGCGQVSYELRAS